MTLDRASAGLSVLLLILMTVLQCFIVVGAVRAVRKVRGEVLRIDEPVSDELPTFRWMPCLRAWSDPDRLGSRLYRWDAFTRPQVRRAWPSTAPYEPWSPFSCDDELWMVQGCLGSPAEDERLEESATTDAAQDVVARYRTHAAALRGKVLFIQDREPWQDVSTVFTAIRDSAIPDETWVLRVWSKGRGLGDWRWRRVSDAVEGAPEIRLHGRPAQGRKYVWLEAGGWRGAFPLEPSVSDLGWRIAAAPFEALGEEPDETPPRHKGVNRFEPGGHTLRFDVPDEPDILLRWTPPPTPSVTLDLLAGVGGIAFALLVLGFAGTTRRRTGPSRPS